MGNGSANSRQCFILFFCNDLEFCDGAGRCYVSIHLHRINTYSLIWVRVSETIPDQGKALEAHSNHASNRSFLVVTRRSGFQCQ